MKPTPRTEDTRPLAYFAPDTYVLMATHDPALSPEAVVERLAQTRVGRSNKILNDSLRRASDAAREQQRLPLRYEPSPRFWEEEAEYLPQLRGSAHTTFSFVYLDMPPRRQRSPKEVIALLDEVNRQLNEEADEHEDIVIQALVPNWFCNATPKVIGTGGPGARPVAMALDPQWHTSVIANTGTPFGFHSPTLDQLDARGGERRRVEVALLDTAPSERQLTAAYDRWNAEHPLIRSLLAPNEHGERRLRVSYADDFLKGSGIALPQESGIKGHEYTMEDHGLFAAGIVHTLAPDADLHLIEVLNRWGVGSLETIARGVDAAIARRRDPDATLVINCSLMLSVPRPADGGRAAHSAPDFPLKADDPNFVKLWSMQLCLACDRARSAGAIITAAAGNDAELVGEDRLGTRPPARFPAAFNSVVGVGALTAGGTPAGYSNFSDEPRSKGFVTFGGDVVIPTGATGADAPMTANVQHGILGVYTGDFPNLTATIPATTTGAYPRPLRNRNGWARWAGTSFATPVISGALARAIGNGIDPTDAEHELRKAETAVSSLGEETFTVMQG